MIYQPTKAKRELIFLTCLIISGVLLWAGMGTALRLSISNKVTTASLAEVQQQQSEQLDYLEKRLNLTEIAITSLQVHNGLTDRVQFLENDVNEIKAKFTSTTFLISYVSARFLLGKQVIRQANREWKKGKVDAGFIDFLNLSLPCGDECPLSLGTAKKCVFHHGLKDLYMEFDDSKLMIPRINNKMKLVAADPFFLMLQNENKTCKVTYTSPTTAIVSSEMGGCTYSEGIKKHGDLDIILAPLNDCQFSHRDLDNSRYFGIDRCEERKPGDERDFVQTKAQQGLNHIYCPLSQITIEGRTYPCANDVFVLPASASFKLNNNVYDSSQINYEHADLADPLFTMKANWHLQPRVNLSALKTQHLLNDTIAKLNKGKDNHHHPITTYATLGTVTIIVLLLILLIVLVIRNGRQKIRVSLTKPKGPKDEKKGEVNNSLENELHSLQTLSIRVNNKIL